MTGLAKPQPEPSIQEVLAGLVERVGPGSAFSVGMLDARVQRPGRCVCVLGREPAVDKQRLTGDEVRRCARQKYRGAD